MKKQLYFLVYLFCTLAFCQVPQIDPTFNGNDLGFNNGGGFTPFISNVFPTPPVNKFIVQPDGKILFDCTSDYNNQVRTGFLRRLNADGTLDTAFNDNVGAIGVYLPFVDVVKYGCQPDGKIIAIGNFFFSPNFKSIIRLNSDGTLDDSFNEATGSVNVNSARDFVVEPDGKIIVVGSFTSIAGNPCNNICRLNADGSFDNTFNTGGSGALFGSNGSYINTIRVLPNGKSLILGNFAAYNGVLTKQLAVLNPDGSLDTSFNSGTGFASYSNDTLKILAIQPDGKFFVVGDFTEYNGTTVKQLIRINANGTLDTSFSIGTGFKYSYIGPISGATFYDGVGKVDSMVIQPDGKIVIGGVFETYNGVNQRNILRLNTNGSLDTSFHNGMGTCNDYSYYNGLRRGEVYAMAQTSAGKIIIGGEFIRYNYSLTGYFARLEPNGDLDLTFNSGTGFNSTINCSAVLSDGKIIVAGDFTKYFGVDRKGIARLNTDGSLDTTFNIGTGAEGVLYSIYNSNAFRQNVNTLAIQPDNKILIGGIFKSFNGVPKNSLVRLNPDGSIDSSFNTASTPDPVRVRKIILQSTGKILAAIDLSIVRLNANGTLDSTFSAIPFYDTLNLIQAPNGAIYVYSYNGSSYYLNRFSYDGILDTTFATVQCSGMMTMDLQSDGKLIIGGNFTYVNNMNITNLARINTNGTLDVSFYPSISFIPSIIKVLSNDKMLIGESNSNSSQPVKLYKLSANGTLDSVYTQQGSYDSTIKSITLDEGKVYLGGSFTSVETTGRNRFVRLLDPNITLGIDHHSDTEDMTVYPNPTKDILNINVSNGVVVDKVEVYNNLGQLVLSQKNLTDNKMLDVSSLRSGIYYLKINADEKQITRKFIKE